MTALSRLFVGLIVAATLPGRVEAQTRVEIGYMPILPVSQLFVALDEGWIKAAGVEPKLVQFQNGPAMVQALLAGQLDVAHFGIGPAMVARGKGADIKVVAASIVEQISFIALKQLAPYLESGNPSTAFARFEKDKGRKAVVTTFPVGSVPEIVLQHWLRRMIKANPDDVRIIYQGAAQVQQALLTGAVDGAAILEPIVTSVIAKADGARIIAHGSQMFPGQPGAVLAVRERLIRDQPDIVKALVAAHARATDVLNKEPERAATAVKKYVGGGRLPLDTVQASLRRSAGTFVADPGAIVEGTRKMRDFQQELGSLKVKVDVETLIETRFYDGHAK